MNPSNRIIFLTRRLSPAIGGMETQANEFVKYFSHNSDTPLATVCTITPTARAYRGIVAEGELLSLPAPAEFLREESRTNADELCNVIARNLPSGGTLFIDTLFWIQVLPTIRRRFPDLTIVLSSGGNDIVQAQGAPGATVLERQEFVVDTINSNVHWLAVNSAYSFDRNKEIGIQKEKMRIVRGGVDVDLFHSTNKKNASTIEVLTAGRLVPFKGTEHILQALKLLSKKAEVHLTIVGDGPELPKLKQLTRALEIEQQVTFILPVTWEAMPSYYNVADIYCSTPILYTELSGGPYIHTETMGRTFCEAAASGIPSIGTFTGGVPEIVEDGKTGILVQAKDIKQIAEALERLASDADLRARLGTHAREKAVQEFSWQTVFGAYKELFRS